MLNSEVYGEGELRDELIAKAESLGLDGKNIFHGRIYRPRRTHPHHVWDRYFSFVIYP